MICFASPLEIDRCLEHIEVLIQMGRFRLELKNSNLSFAFATLSCVRGRVRSLAVSSVFLSLKMLSPISEPSY